MRRRVSPHIDPTRFHELISGQRRGLAASLLRGLLHMAAVGYRGAVEWRNRRFDRNRSAVQRVGVPVVSVGNITAGGTGKTPMVAWLADWFLKRGVRVAIVSRGYRAPSAAADDTGGNDEARELAQRLPQVPHVQNPDRVAAARQAIAQDDCQLIVLDDAFQHRRIHRDLDIVLIDALQPFGFRHLLPRGLLREPLHRLARADLIALSRADAVSLECRRQLRDEVSIKAPQAGWIEVVHQPQKFINAAGESHEPRSLFGCRIAVFCGIGNPHGFYHSLADIGCEIVARHEFPDHHHFSAEDLQLLEQWLADLPQVEAVICTCKDLVKIDTIRIGSVPLWALMIGVEISEGYETLQKLLIHLLPDDHISAE